jgi:molecular chaperone DnaK
MVYSTEKSLGEHGEKLEAADKDNIQKAIDELKEILKDESASSENIKSKLDALNTAAMKLGEIMYKQHQQEAGQQGESKAGGENKAEENTTKSDKEEDIVDADFEEVKEDKEKKSN